MITAFKPPVKPLSETWIGDADLQKLEESQKRADLFASRKSEVDRRLQQTTEWRNKVHQALQTKDVGPRERRTMEIDMETATRELDNLAHDLNFILEQIEVEKKVQDQAQARLDIIKAERSESVWMVSSLGIPMQWRIAGKKEEAVANEQSASSVPKYFDDDNAEDEGDDEEELEELSQDSLVPTEPVVHLLSPDSVCEGADGTVYVTDTLHSCIRKIVPAGTVHHFAGRETTHADLIPPPPPPEPTQRPATRIRSRRDAEGEGEEGGEEDEEEEGEGRETGEGGENEEKTEGKETEEGWEKEKTEKEEEKEEEEEETDKIEEGNTEEDTEEAAKLVEDKEEKKGAEEEEKDADKTEQEGEKTEEGKTKEKEAVEEEKDGRNKGEAETETGEKEEGEAGDKDTDEKAEEQPEGKTEEDTEKGEEEEDGQVKNGEEKGETEKTPDEQGQTEGEEAKEQEQEETGGEKAVGEEKAVDDKGEDKIGEGGKAEEKTEEGETTEGKTEEEPSEVKTEAELTEEAVSSDKGRAGAAAEEAADEEAEEAEEEALSSQRLLSSVAPQIVELNRPRGIVMEEGGNFFVCDTGNHCIRGISADGTRATTLAGVPRSAGFEDGLAREARFNSPWAACLGELRGGQPALFVCDAANHCVRAVHFASDAAEAPARVSTVLGTPQHAGCDAAHLNFPWSCCWTPQGLAVGDKYNRRLLLCSLDPGVPLRVLSEAWPAELCFGPRGIVVDAQGCLLLSDSWNSRLWRVPLSGSPLEKVAGSGLQNHRDGRAEFAEFRYPGGMCLDRNGALLVVDVGNHCVRKLRELREQEVKAKLRKMMDDMSNRGVRNAFFTWTMAPSQAPEPPQPVEVVLALAMGTHAQLGEGSPLASFPSDALRHTVEGIAKALLWRVVRTREEAQTTFVADEDELAARMEEARKVFTEFDVDGGGSIDAKELREALESSGMVVSDEELTALIDEYDADKSGEISFDEFCAMQGITLAPPEPPPQVPPANAKPKAPAKKPGPGSRRPAANPAPSKDGKPTPSRAPSREGGRSSPSPPPRSGSPLNASAAPRARAGAAAARPPRSAASPLPAKPRASASKPAAGARASAGAAPPTPAASVPARATRPPPAAGAAPPPAAGAGVAGAGAGAGARQRVSKPASPAPMRGAQAARPAPRRPTKA